MSLCAVNCFILMISVYCLVGSCRPVAVPLQGRTRVGRPPVEVWAVWTLRVRPSVEVKDVMEW